MTSHHHVMTTTTMKMSVMMFRTSTTTTTSEDEPTSNFVTTWIRAFNTDCFFLERTRTRNQKTPLHTPTHTFSPYLTHSRTHSPMHANTHFDKKSNQEILVGLSGRHPIVVRSIRTETKIFVSVCWFLKANTVSPDIQMRHTPSSNQPLSNTVAGFRVMTTGSHCFGLWNYESVIADVV